MKLKYKNNIYNLNSKSNNSKIETIVDDELYEIDIVNSSYKYLKNKSLFKVEDKKYIYVSTGRQYFKFEKIDDDFSYKDAITVDENHQLIQSPTPGSVVKIFVTLDQAVQQGDPLIIIESMKMENTIYSSIDGNITKIDVQLGEQISNDKILMEITK